MCKRNNSDLFFVCSLIEQLGRDLQLRRSEVVTSLGEQNVRTLLSHADVLHCEPIQKVADDIMTEFNLSKGAFNNVARAKFSVPDVWTVGKVYARLIEDVSGEDNVTETLMAVYTSWIDEKVSDYNSSFYYEPRDYIAECYRAGEVIDG